MITRAATIARLFKIEQALVVLASNPKATKADLLRDAEVIYNEVNSLKNALAKD